MNKKIYIFISIFFIIIFILFLYKNNIKIGTNINEKKDININKIFENVRYTGDKSKCDDIINENYNKQCLAVAESVDIFKKVINSGDSTDCNKIKDVKVKQKCFLTINSMEYRIDAIITGDSGICNSIKDITSKNMCIMRVNLFNKIVIEGKSENCIKFLNNDIIEECKKRILGTN